MTLASGTQLNHYEILRSLGAGGMGEVYLARDLKLGRDVAIKILPPAFVKDPDRLARFEREARMLASLNHPNIAQIYGLDEAGDLHFLILEYVSGETLAERLKRGSLPLQESLGVCGQIAEGLEAAHKKGIIHRDLKPANVKITVEGKVKILDFGLAKAFADQSSNANFSNSPTVTSAGTQHGVILGTAPYMSPEQARGQSLDVRTDIWSFGCVLYESLTGRMAFMGGTVSDIIAVILQRDIDWNALPPDLPAGVLRLLRRCLQKDCDQRLQHIGDARIEIQEALQDPEPKGRVVVKSNSSRLWMAVAIVSVIVAAAAVVMWSTSRSKFHVEYPVSRFEITFPVSSPLVFGECSSFAISPDGSRLIYVGRADQGHQLFLRSLTSFEAQAIPGTNRAGCPFFSADGKSAGFFAGYTLMKVSLPQGPTQVLLNGVAPPGTMRGATWSATGDIYFSTLPRDGLLRTSANETKVWNLSDPGIGKGTLRWPDLLPGNQYAIATMVESETSTFDQADIVLVDLETGKHRTLIRGGFDAKFSTTGHIVFARSHTLLAVPFQLSTRKVTGQAVTILNDVRTDPWSGVADYSFSNGGTLAYLPSTASKMQTHVVWVNRDGKEKPVFTDERDISFLALSPDGQRLAYSLRGVHNDIWIYDFLRGAASRFTFGGTNIRATWSPDGSKIAYLTANPGLSTTIVKSADGSNESRVMLTDKFPIFPGPWSPNGEFFAYVEYNPSTLSDIYLLPRSKPGKAIAFLKSPFQEAEPVFSPDSRWLAFVSFDSGRPEVYVRPVLSEGPKWKISTNGGAEIRWPANSHELFYRHGNQMMAVEIQTDPEFKPGIPHVIFAGDYRMSPSIHAAMYDVTPDGQKFLMIKTEGSENTASRVRVVLSWFDELKRLVPNQ